MTKEELLKKIDFEKSWLYECGIFGSDVDIAFHSIENSVIETLEHEECEDCISRKAALKLFEDMFIELQKVHQKDTQYGVNWCINTLKDLPSVNPQKSGWIPVSERLPTKEEYIANNGLFIVSDGNRTYSEYFDVYSSMKFGEPTMSGFRVDRCVIAWMPLPETYKEQK